MKQTFFLLLLFSFFTAMSCRNTEVSQKVYGTPMSDQVTEAFERLAAGAELEARLDTVLGSVTVKLFTGPCNSKLVETEHETGSGMPVKRFISINQCTQMESELKAGYVFVPVVDQMSGRPVWVPLPALLKPDVYDPVDKAEAETLNMQVREIYLTSDGQSATKLLVQI